MDNGRWVNFQGLLLQNIGTQIFADQRAKEFEKAKILRLPC
jgi:hypothetical protein